MRDTAYIPPAEAARLAADRAAALGTAEGTAAAALAAEAVRLGGTARLAAAAEALAALGLADRALPADRVDGRTIVDGQDGPAVLASAVLRAALAEGTAEAALAALPAALAALAADPAAGAHCGTPEAEGGAVAYCGSAPANLARGTAGTPEDAAGMQTYALPLRGEEMRRARLGLALRRVGRVGP